MTRTLTIQRLVNLIRRREKELLTELSDRIEGLGFDRKRARIVFEICEEFEDLLGRAVQAR